MHKNVMYYGKEEDQPGKVELRAGPLSLWVEEGDLRQIRLGGTEILRRVYVAVRDRNWGTVPPVLKNMKIDTHTDHFHILYEVENRQEDIAFAWRGEITGDTSGKIVFKMEGEALSTFYKNRIGFCVLHPASAAGHRCLVEHVDGSREEGILPVLISSDQPVLPFSDMRFLACESAPGLWTDVFFDGDVFEMEDQRNWSDASFKTFCTPLRLAYPVKINAGEHIAQQITIQVRDEPYLQSVIKQAEVRDACINVQLDPGRWQALPELGLGCASHGHSLSEREVLLLSELNLHHLRVELDPSASDFKTRLEQAVRDSRQLGIGLEMVLLVSENEHELADLRAAIDDVKPPVSNWTILPAQENYQGGSPTRQVVMAVRHYLGDRLSHAPLATGTNTDFIFLKRTEQPVDLVDRIVVSINPQVHAFDLISLVETLETQTVIVKNVSLIAKGKPVMVSPITLKPRFNVYATSSQQDAWKDILPPQVDQRQMSLFGAGWTLGSLGAVMSGGAVSATYYETTGWRGVIETESGSPLPKQFQSIAGGVFPLYHVLADFGQYAEGEGQTLQSSQPQDISGVALQKGHQWSVVLANHTGDSQEVVLKGLPGSSVRVRMLDETNVQEAMAQPRLYRTRKHNSLVVQNNQVKIILLPYGLVTISGDHLS